MGSVRAERTGKLVGGGRASLKRFDPPDGTRAVGLRSRIASDGTFVFDGLVGGEYIVRVSHPKFEDVSQRVQVGGIETLELIVACATDRCGE